MRVELEKGSGHWAEVDLERGVDVSRAVAPHGAGAGAGVEAFGIPDASCAALLDTRAGATVNCETLSVCCHGNGTHTECVGHITTDRVSVQSCAVPAFGAALLVTVTATEQGGAEIQQPQGRGQGRQRIERGDMVVSRDALELAVQEALASASSAGFEDFKFESLVVRTLPRAVPAPDGRVVFSRANPPFFALDAMRYVRNGLRTMHLLVDLPSVDREDSGASVPCHAVFFGLEPGCKDADKAACPRATITELCSVAGDLADGAYLLSLQVAPIHMDAAPSRPILYRAVARSGSEKRPRVGVLAAAVLVATLGLLWCASGHRNSIKVV